jgi:hypothetical protein
MGINPESQWLAPHCDGHLRQNGARVLFAELRSAFDPNWGPFAIGTFGGMETYGQEYRVVMSCDWELRRDDGHLEAA